MNEGEQRDNEIRIDVADGGGVGIPNFALRARCVWEDDDANAGRQSP